MSNIFEYLAKHHTLSRSLWEGLIKQCREHKHSLLTTLRAQGLVSKQDIEDMMQTLYGINFFKVTSLDMFSHIKPLGDSRDFFYYQDTSTGHKRPLIKDLGELEWLTFVSKIPPEITDPYLLHEEIFWRLKYHKEIKTFVACHTMSCLPIEELLRYAVLLRASDIHLQPYPRYGRVQMRVQGVFSVSIDLPIEAFERLCGQIKILADLNLAMVRHPQDGRFTQSICGRFVNFRLSVHPTEHGSNFVLRLLDPLIGLKSIPELGWSAQDLVSLQSALNNSSGIILMVGPTGSGKTTTLYALIRYLLEQGKNIVSLEQPIEYSMPHIRQTSIAESDSIDFAAGIRSVLRQDPDVILVGEIRDEETARMAFRASITGHLVLTTVHAYDVHSTITRLQDLGLSPLTLKEQLQGVAIQELHKTACPHCQGHNRDFAFCFFCEGTSVGPRTLQGVFYDNPSIMTHLQV